MVYRIGADEFISPFVRATVGVLINNQSPLLVVGEANNGAELVIYDDEQQRHPASGPRSSLGVGRDDRRRAKGYQIRWEIRDNIVGIQQVTGAVADTRRGAARTRPTYRHIFSLNVGLDVILEKRRGRRY